MPAMTPFGRTTAPRSVPLNSGPLIAAVDKSTDDNGFLASAGGVFPDGTISGHASTAEAIDELVTRLPGTLGQLPAANGMARQLVLVGHGAPGVFTTGAGAHLSLPGERLECVRDGDLPAWEQAFARLAAFRNSIDVITIVACEVAAGPSGLDLLRRMAKTTQCTVRAFHRQVLAGPGGFLEDTAHFEDSIWTVVQPDGEVLARSPGADTARHTGPKAPLAGAIEPVAERAMQRRRRAAQFALYQQPDREHSARYRSDIRAGKPLAPPTKKRVQLEGEHAHRASVYACMYDMAKALGVDRLSASERANKAPRYAPLALRTGIATIDLEDGSQHVFQVYNDSLLEDLRAPGTFYRALLPMGELEEELAV